MAESASESGRSLGAASVGSTGHELSVDILFVLIGAFPFVSLYLGHFAYYGEAATGFLQADQPYYMANAREIYERGNGLAYPNPYDPDPDAPVIYFHWLFIPFGLLIAKLGYDPGFVYSFVGVSSIFAFSALTFVLVREYLQTRVFARIFFLMGMWGGGLFCLAAFAQNVLHSEPAFRDLLRFDPEEGMWFLNWGRNCMYMTETVYHVITMCCWLALSKGRKWRALSCACLLGATHPWSGLQLLLTVNAVMLVEFARSRAKDDACALLIAMAGLGLFLGYYFLYLPSHATHAALKHVWQIEWVVSDRSAVLAWGPVFVLAVASLTVNRGTLGRRHMVMVTAFLVSAGLALHDRVIDATQPLHFTRGMVWMPLFLLSLPLLRDFVLRLRWGVSRWAGLLMMVSLLALISVDNAVFVLDYHRNFSRKGTVPLRKIERDALEWLEERGIEGILFCDQKELSYISATYTRVRPYYGHLYNTPDYHERFNGSRNNRWVEGQEPDYLLLTSREGTRVIEDPREWKVIYSAQDDGIGAFVLLLERL